MLLSTKLKAPQQSSFIVARPRLFALLDQATNCNATLVVAPAGYGKTTLITSWLAQTSARRENVTWLMLDEYDDEPARFIRYLIAALQQVVPGLGLSVQEQLQAMPMAPLPTRIEEMLTLLINELAELTSSLILVLDDLHHLRDPQLVNGVRFWIDHAPPQIHTVVTTRDASLLPLARWQVRRQCIGLTASDLRFNTEEAAAFIRDLLRLDLNDNELQQLLERTEGWIAGLQLAAMSLQSSDDPARLLQNFTGSDRYVTDYLIEEVLEKQPAELREFLLKSSLVARLSAPLCDALLSRDDSFQILEQLERRNLFLIPLDNQRHWYRYHPLFAEALRARLPLLEQHTALQLHERAYQWFVAHDEPEEALVHALAAKRYPEATNLIFAQCYAIIWDQGRPRVFLRWCEQIPERYLFTIPRLVLAIGWALLLLGRREQLAEWTKRMRAKWEATAFDFNEGAEIRNEVALLEAELAVQQGNIQQVMTILDSLNTSGALLTPTTQATAEQLYGYAYRLDGNIIKAKEFLHRAIQITEQVDTNSLWLFSHFDLAETHVIAGELTTALAIYEKIQARYPYERYRNYLSLAYIYHRLAHLLYLQNRLGAATEYVQRCLEIAKQSKWLRRYPTMVLAEIQYLQGQWSAALAAINQVRSRAGTKESPTTYLFFETAIAKLLLLRGDINGAANLANTDPQFLDHLPRYQRHQVEITLARYQLATDPERAITQLDDLAASAQQLHWHIALVEIQVLRALGYQQLAQTDEAIAALVTALTIAAPQQLIAPFLVEGAPMATLLRHALTQHPQLRTFIGQLQAAFLPVATDEPARAPQPLVEPLTPRELDVLALMATGLSNPEIAEKLIVATGTIAKHTNNIFGKLAVRNRTEATQRAHALGLLKP